MGDTDTACTRTRHVTKKLIFKTAVIECYSGVNNTWLLIVVHEHYREKILLDNIIKYSISTSKIQLFVVGCAIAIHAGNQLVKVGITTAGWR